MSVHAILHKHRRRFGGILPHQIGPGSAADAAIKHLTPDHHEQIICAALGSPAVP
jgi:hypothetical protein